MIDEELEHDQARTYRYWEADRYTLITKMRRIPFFEYMPEDAYGERAFNTAFELNKLGALMTIFITQDQLLRHMVETAESEDDFTKRSLRKIFLFLDENPTAVKKMVLCRRVRRGWGRQYPLWKNKNRSRNAAFVCTAGSVLVRMQYMHYWR